MVKENEASSGILYVPNLIFSNKFINYSAETCQTCYWPARVNQQPPVHQFRMRAIQAVLGMNQKHILFPLPRDFSAPFSAPKFSPPTYLPTPHTSLTSFRAHSISKAQNNSRAWLAHSFEKTGDTRLEEAGELNVEGTWRGESKRSASSQIQMREKKGKLSPPFFAFFFFSIVFCFCFFFFFLLLEKKRRHVFFFHFFNLCLKRRRRWHKCVVVFCFLLWTKQRQQVCCHPKILPSYLPTSPDLAFTPSSGLGRTWNGRVEVATKKKHLKHQGKSRRAKTGTKSERAK